MGSDDNSSDISYYTYDQPFTTTTHIDMMMCGKWGQCLS